MPKHAEKAKGKKVVKEVKKLKKAVHAEKKHAMAAVKKVATYPSKTMNFKSANPGKDGPNSKEVPYKMAQDYVFCLLNPAEGYIRQTNCVVPTGNMVETTTFWTKNVLNLSTVSNAYTTTNDLQVTLFPFGNGLIHYATAFSGVNGRESNGTDVNATNYSSWGTNFGSVRCVCLGMQIRNTLAAGSENGDMIQFRSTNDVVFSYNFSQFASMSDSVLRGLTKPGDMGLVHWRPNSSSASGDTQFKVPSASYASYATAGTSGTNVQFWASCGTAAQTTFEVSVYAAWEAIVLPSAAGLFDTQTNCANQNVANDLLVKALNKCPDYCQQRVVCTDDGIIESVLEDGKSIYGGIKSVVNLGKTIAGAIGDVFGGWFAPAPPKRVHNVLMHFLDDEIVVNRQTGEKTCPVFDMLKWYISNNPHATLADALVFFCNFDPPDPSPPDDGKSDSGSLVQVESEGRLYSRPLITTRLDTTPVTGGAYRGGSTPSVRSASMPPQF